MILVLGMLSSLTYIFQGLPLFAPHKVRQKQRTAYGQVPHRRAGAAFITFMADHRTSTKSLNGNASNYDVGARSFN